jgi:hypothetical protein
MSLFMKDPKKLATLIVEGASPDLKKKPETADGAEKDVTPANEDRASKLLAAVQANDAGAFMNSLRSFIKDVLNESTDEKPEVPSSRII